MTPRRPERRATSVIPPRPSRGSRSGRARPSRPRRALAAALLVLFSAGCRQDMHDQPKYRAARGSSFFADGALSRPLVPGTVARGRSRGRALPLHRQGRRRVPWPRSRSKVTAELLARGRERYDIFCSPCHGRPARRRHDRAARFKQPGLLPRRPLRQAPIGYFFDVITNGFGVMPTTRPRCRPEDRWAIVAYVRALQLSQNAASRTCRRRPSSTRARREPLPAHDLGDTLRRDPDNPLRRSWSGPASPSAWSALGARGSARRLRSTRAVLPLVPLRLPVLGRASPWARWRS
jgi:hypothetical protein